MPIDLSGAPPLAFESASESDLRTLKTLTLRLAVSAQAWALKPAAVGGGGPSFEGLTLRALTDGLGEDDHTEVPYASGTTHSIALALEAEAAVPTATSSRFRHTVRATVSGVGPRDIDLRVVWR